MAEFDSVIPAGGSGKLVAKMATRPLLDRRVSKTIAIRTDADDASTFNLRFTVDVRAPILFEPSNRLVVSAMEGEEARERVLLRRADGERLEILNADTGSDVLAASVESVSKPERWNDLRAAPGDVWLDLVLPATAPPGSRTGKLSLTTNHPVVPNLEVSYAMRVRPLIEARPSIARLWTSPDGRGEGSSSFLTLRRNGGGDFAIKAIGVSHPDVFSAAPVTDGPGRNQTLRVELVEGVSMEKLNGTVEGWIELSTDIPSHPSVRVPVLVASSREASLRGFPTSRRK